MATSAYLFVALRLTQEQTGLPSVFSICADDRQLREVLFPPEEMRISTEVRSRLSREEFPDVFPNLSVPRGCAPMTKETEERTSGQATRASAPIRMEFNCGEAHKTPWFVLGRPRLREDSVRELGIFPGPPTAGVFLPSSNRQLFSLSIYSMIEDIHPDAVERQGRENQADGSMEKGGSQAEERPEGRTAIVVHRLEDLSPERQLASVSRCNAPLSTCSAPNPSERFTHRGTTTLISPAPTQVSLARGSLNFVSNREFVYTFGKIAVVPIESRRQRRRGRVHMFCGKLFSPSLCPRSRAAYEPMNRFEFARFSADTGRQPCRSDLLLEFALK